MNSKGDIPSLIISLIVILFVVGIAALVFSKIFLTIIGEMKMMPDFSNNTRETITLVEEKTIPFLDYLIFFSFIAVFIGLIVSSIYIDVHPAIMIIFVLMLVVAIVLSGIFANAFVEIGEQNELSSTYSQFTFTGFIMNHFPLIVLIVGMVVIFIMYGKGRPVGGV